MIAVKTHIRDFINKDLPDHLQTNVMHSSDDHREALEYLDIICPDQKDDILSEFKKLDEDFKTKFPVIKDLSRNANRAKVEVIDYNGKLAVQKTFMPQSYNHLKKALTVYEILSQEIEEIPILFETLGNGFIACFYENRLSMQENRQETITLLKQKQHQIVAFMKKIYDAGYALIDFIPTNVILTPEDELKVVDFEFLYCYAPGEKPASFLESYDVVGVPASFGGDLPKGYKEFPATYKTNWEPIFERPIEDILAEI